MKWLPCITTSELNLDSCAALDLNANYRWEATSIEWFNCGITFLVKPLGPRHAIPPANP